MKKLRSDAHWHTFNPAQQEKIQQWLFADHFSYRKTRELTKTLLGITCAQSTMSHLYHYLEERRSASDYLNALDLADTAHNSGADLEKLRSACEKLVASRFLRTLTSTSSPSEIASLGRLMLRQQSRRIRQDRPTSSETVCPSPTLNSPKSPPPNHPEADQSRT